MIAGFVFLANAILIPKTGKFAIFGWVLAYHLVIFGGVFVYKAFTI